MKISISTLGCPDWSFEQLLERLPGIGINNIEARGIDGQLDAGRIERFSAANAAHTLELLNEAGLSLIGFSSSAYFHKTDELERNIDLVSRELDVCKRMGIPFIRVFGNEGDSAEKLSNIIEGLDAVCTYADELGIGVNLEIHGSINTIEAVEPIIAGASAHKSFGILWDVQHSDKVYGDNWRSFYDVIRPYIRHVHIKDHYRKDHHLCLPGKGEIPLKDIIHTLLDDGYDGFFSFEWEKKWTPSLEEPEIAFPAFVSFMNEI